MEPLRRWHRILACAVVFLALIGVAVAVRRILVVLPTLLPGQVSSFPSNSPVAARLAPLDSTFNRHPWLTLTHIIPGILFMLLGPLQLSATIRRRHPRYHRIAGRVFVAAAYIVGISAIVMSWAMPAIGGVNQAAATTLFGSFFLIALTKAFLHIRRGEIALHREWMLRAFAIGLAVATIRPIIGFFFATSRLTGLTPHDFFGIAFWIGFVLQTIAAEIWIQSTRPPRIFPADGLASVAATQAHTGTQLSPLPRTLADHKDKFA